ncbi:MAG: M28 family metallopeptidase [Pseudonocardia sp.]|nr:M28 family metallopeptidase [Pseudonocardia sp.]
MHHRPTLPGAVTLVAALTCAALLAACSGSAAAPVPDQALPTSLVAQASGDGAFAHLEELQRIADANGGNRALGTPGYDAGVEYVAGKLRDAGYDVQTPTFEATSFSVATQTLTVDGAPVAAEALGFSPSTAGALTAPLAVIAQDDTSGCEASDFAGIPAGSIALIRRGTCTFGVKSQLAGAAGAAAVVVVNTEDAALAGTLGETPGTVPSAGVSSSVGAGLAGRNGAQAVLTLATTIEKKPSRNVIAQTRTGDPANVVMAGAHLDSVPEGPGINDNGTGSAGLLEVATRLGGSPATANAVRFAWWGAEEEGLLGSTAYVEALPEQERPKIALYLNLDMIGSPNAGYLIYDGDDSDKQGEGPGPQGSATIEQVLAEQLRAAGVSSAGTDFDGRSDYGPFIAAGIPSGGLFTGAEEIKTPEQAAQWGGAGGKPYDSCYHQACDTLANVDRTALDRNVDALAGTVGRFALSLQGIRP